MQIKDILHPWLVACSSEWILSILAQIITGMRGCVASTDLFSRSLGCEFTTDNTVKILCVLPFPLYNTCSSGWIFFRGGTNDHQYEMARHAWWLLTLDHNFSHTVTTFLCPFCNVCCSGWILFIFDTRDQWHERVYCMQKLLALEVVYSERRRTRLI